MPTDNPKISSYVPQAVYDRFKQFQDEHNLSMSQAVILILAEYFGLEETIKKSTKGTTIGGITLSRIEALEKENRLNGSLLNELLTRVEFLENSLEELVSVEDQQIEVIYSAHNLSSPQLKLLSEPLQEIKPIMAKTLSELRFRLAKDAVSGHKRRDSTEKFTEWTRERDPDGIAWQYVELPTKGYLPGGELSSEQKSSLLKWIEENIG